MSMITKKQLDIIQEANFDFCIGILACGVNKFKSPEDTQEQQLMRLTSIVDGSFPPTDNIFQMAAARVGELIGCDTTVSLTKSISDSITSYRASDKENQNRDIVEGALFASASIDPRYIRAQKQFNR